MENKIIGFILNFAWDNLFKDDTDDEDAKNIQPKVLNYAEKIVPRFSDKQFQIHFRITTSTFQSLIIKLHDDNSEDKKNVGCKPVPLEKQLMITLWYLSNIESFRYVKTICHISYIYTLFDIRYKTNYNCHNIKNTSLFSLFFLVQWLIVLVLAKVRVGVYSTKHVTVCYKLI